jgi:DnaJ-class molecular chaperone
LATEAKRDYYQTLGVSPSATQEEIEEAHQKLVAELRTSDAPEASDRLVDARKAHIVLADLKKRVRYDESLADAKKVHWHRRRHESNAGLLFDIVVDLLSVFKR